MAKSAAERKRESRAKQNVEKREMEREKAKMGMKRLREKMKNDKAYQLKHRMQSKKGMKELRTRRKQITERDSGVQPYASRQTFGKAIKRVVSSLPPSPRKRRSVILELARRETIVIPRQKTANAGALALSLESKNLVEDFYRRDDISRQLPGRKDVVSVKKDGEMIKIQKRLLTLNLREAWKTFTDDTPDFKIGFSKFCSLRPQEVGLISSKDHAVCCCVYCENLTLLLNAFKFVSGPKTVSQLIEVIVCNKNSAACMWHTCNTCNIQEKLKIMCDVCSELRGCNNIEVNQWKGGILEKKSYTWNTMQSLAQTTKILEHAYHVSRQAKELQNHKDNLKPGQLIMMIDFAENYNIKHQNEIMQAHWHNNSPGSSVTIYTTVLYYKQDIEGDMKIDSYAVISDTLRHTTKEVSIFNRAILADWSERNATEIQSVILWSDGAAAHFKNRYAMASFSSSKTFTSWNYTESYHGKGPHDGVGATVKRLIWQKVLRKEIVVRNPREFFDELKNCDQLKTRCLYISEHSMVDQQVELDKFFKAALPVKRIHASRSVQNMRLYKIRLYRNTGDKVPMSETMSTVSEEILKHD